MIKLSQADVPSHLDATYAMTYGDDLYLANSAGELVAVLVSDYTDPDADDGHDEALFKRVKYLITVGNAVQGSLIESAVEDGGFDPGSASDDVLTALGQDRIEPFEGPDLAWQQHVPLVLIRIDYAPYTPREAPYGNVIWLDPSTELTFLESIHSVGIAQLLIKPGAESADSPTSTPLTDAEGT